MDAGPRIFTEVEDLHPDFDDGEAIKRMSEVRDYTQTLIRTRQPGLLCARSLLFSHFDLEEHRNPLATHQSAGLNEKVSTSGTGAWGLKG